MQNLVLRKLDSRQASFIFRANTGFKELHLLDSDAEEVIFDTNYDIANVIIDGQIENQIGKLHFIDKTFTDEGADTKINISNSSCYLLKKC